MSLAQVDIAENDSRFVEPLVRSVKKLATAPDQVVLLGSIATAKYVDALLPLLGDRLVFPEDFVGRGDMSRGALMLRAKPSEESELSYLPVAGSVRRGSPCARYPRKVQVGGACVALTNGDIPVALHHDRRYLLASVFHPF